MNLNLFKKYQNKQETKIKNKLIDKLLESKEIDKLIEKIQNLYQRISEQLFIKYDLKNELKQGKIFTILIAILIFLFLIVLTVFFIIMLNSLLGLNLIFSMLKYSIFIIKWVYTIIKNKGKVIQKYLGNLFPNSKILKEESIQITNLLVTEKNIIKEIEELIRRIENIDDNYSNSKKEFIFEIQGVTGFLKVQNKDLKKELDSLEYKMKIILSKEELKDQVILIDSESNMPLDSELDSENVYIKRKKLSKGSFYEY